MPSRARVQAFVEMIQRGEFLQSIPEFYAEDMVAQENVDPPRIGRAAQVANEEATLARLRVERTTAESFLVDGDRVAIHWIFEMRAMTGETITMNEIAYQLWRGDRIEREQYFYDPAQRRPKPAAK